MAARAQDRVTGSCECLPRDRARLRLTRPAVHEIGETKQRARAEVGIGRCLREILQDCTCSFELAYELEVGRKVEAALLHGAALRRSQPQCKFAQLCSSVRSASRAEPRQPPAPRARPPPRPAQKRRERDGARAPPGRPPSPRAHDALHAGARPAQRRRRPTHTEGARTRPDHRPRPPRDRLPHLRRAQKASTNLSSGRAAAATRSNAARLSAGSVRMRARTSASTPDGTGNGDAAAPPARRRAISSA